MFQDQGGSRKMAGRADDLGAGPAMGGHDALAEKDVLNGVRGQPLFDDGVRWNSLGLGERGHDMRLYETVVGGSAREDEVRSDARLELANAFERALSLLR